MDYNFLKDIPSQRLGYIFENIIQRIYSKILVGGSICIDGGAQHGLHTIPMARLVGETGQVLAFEPIEESMRILHSKLHKHSLEKSVCLFNYAIADHNGLEDFTIIADEPGYSGLQDRGYCPESKRVVRDTITVTIDTIFSQMNYQRLDFLKLDIEGGEFHALKGACQSIKSFRPIIIFEHAREASAKLYHYTANDFFTLIGQLGYALYDILGVPFTQNDWEKDTPWYFIAMPKETHRKHKEFIHTKELSNILEKKSTPPFQKIKNPSPHFIRFIPPDDSNTKTCSIEDFEKFFGFIYTPQLLEENNSFQHIHQCCANFLTSSKLNTPINWIGLFDSAYHENVQKNHVADVTIKWINKKDEYGLFAKTKIKAWSFIGEYTGILRKEHATDEKNNHNFSYPIFLPKHERFTIDSKSYGNELRYLKHSHSPNTLCRAVFCDGILHSIFISIKDISPEEQITFNYKDPHGFFQKI